MRSLPSESTNLIHFLIKPFKKHIFWLSGRKLRSTSPFNFHQGLPIKCMQTTGRPSRATNCFWPRSPTSMTNPSSSKWPLPPLSPAPKSQDCICRYPQIYSEQSCQWSVHSLYNSHQVRLPGPLHLRFDPILNQVLKNPPWKENNRAEVYIRPLHPADHVQRSFLPHNNPKTQRWQCLLQHRLCHQPSSHPLPLLAGHCRPHPPRRWTTNHLVVHKEENVRDIHPVAGDADRHDGLFHAADQLDPHPNKLFQPQVPHRQSCHYHHRHSPRPLHWLSLRTNLCLLDP